MKVLNHFLVLIPLFWCLGAHAQTFAGNSNLTCSSAATTCAVTVTGSVAAGDTLGVCVIMIATGRTIAGVADNLSQTYSAIPSLADRTDATDPAIGGCRDFVNSTSGTNPAITVTVSSAPGGTWEVFGYHLSGVSTAPHDGASSAANANTGTSGTPFTSGNFTPTKANAIIIGFSTVDNGALSIGSGFTSRLTDAGGPLGAGPFSIMESKTVTSTGTYNGAFTSATSGDDGIIFGMAYDSSSQPPTGPPPNQYPRPY